MGIEGSIRRLTEMIGTPVGPVGRDDLYTNNRRADGTLRDEREPRNNGVHRCDRERRDVRPHHEDRERRDDGPRHEDRERRDDQGRDSGESRRRSPPHGTGKRSGKDRAVSYTGAGKRGKLDGDARYEAGSRQSSDSDAERDELRKELDEAKKLILALRARDSREEEQATPTPAPADTQGNQGTGKEHRVVRHKKRTRTKRSRKPRQLNQMELVAQIVSTVMKTMQQQQGMATENQSDDGSDSGNSTETD
ncbi:transcription coactivator CAPER [Carpediemonas membranifera]|uniref:Transcription coactivator CAPER n=1 Tax=Carpediemonas membranifera TaxID=201153 RepID=A0A8J6E0X9_9EUKA|nr:transcription coactivator CAPER [Carpediemonas membranifera]|eukprot:KAG9392768.1 transcription coactivator CAPER [Carpediemonas membranifera]